MTHPTKLQDFSVFSQLTQSKLVAVHDKGQVKEFENGDMIFGQNEQADTFYCLLEGSVELQFIIQETHTKTDIQYEESIVRSHQVVDKPIILETLSSGDIFGWSSMVSRNIYTSTAKCTMPTKVFCIESNLLRTILDADPEMGYVFMSNLTEVISHRLHIRTEALVDSWKEAYGINKVS